MFCIAECCCNYQGQKHCSILIYPVLASGAESVSVGSAVHNRAGSVNAESLLMLERFCEPFRIFLTFHVSLHPPLLSCRDVRDEVLEHGE